MIYKPATFNYNKIHRLFLIEYTNSQNPKWLFWDIYKHLSVYENQPHHYQIMRLC